ncbi:MAG: hypothetical protein GTN89_11940 [Acidobacteria bacterium]|nr:hypothetical protein [Acidobacteriota bacterium]NIM61016.1 hypothetical protein [Acidobacteriota bacterium]NIO59984.1 hypothetical protein [Acidobacteriota bacterium]NIQ31056.1 hypothetical protein [Acidobacteriota bacterium]NIQ86184.1 hypothetical protein [Acidobacteriota bacterium]
MIGSRRWTVGVLAAVLFLHGCGPRKLSRDPAAGPQAAVYRARFDPGPSERARKFRLLVFAAEPDRLHGEILSAVGTTELVLDAGGGQVSVFFVRDRTAYVGAADADVLEALTGVRVSVGDFVQALLGHVPAAPGGAPQWSLDRTGRPYPDRIGLKDGERSFELQIKRVRAIRADPATLGTGQPPDGALRRPLEDLDPDTLPGVETEGEGEA